MPSNKRMLREDMMEVKIPLCLLLFISTISASYDVPSDIFKRQTDALDKLYFDSTKLQRVAGLTDSSMPSSNPTVLRSNRIYPQQGLKKADKITKLPGQPRGINFDQYGGYVTVDQQAGRALFYYLAEAPRANRSSMPLLIWFTGGPGCSSIGVGAMEELGPFRVRSDGKTLFWNPYAWNNVANVLFIESPAGTGFSYSNTTSDYSKMGDQMMADDAYVFLVNWLERFPEYKERDLYLTGESYAGHSVTQLAHTILEHNRQSPNATANITTINLKGIMLGNAVLNDETDNRGRYDFLWSHAFISDEAIGQIHKYCNFTPNANNSQLCSSGLSEASFRDINIYNIYAPGHCSGPGITQKPAPYSIEDFDSCDSQYIDTYLNTHKVQQALHANVTNLNYTWSSCSEFLMNWGDSPSTVLPLIKEIMNDGVRVWVYSGDVDGRIPVTSTRYSLNELKLSVKTKWSPWYIKNEVAGFGLTYDGNLTFSTVRGAGHQVPSYRPRQALVLVSCFIEGILHSV